MSPRPQVLFLSQRFLFPQDTGGKIRTAATLAAMKGRWDLTVLGNYDHRQDGAYLEAMQRLAGRYLPVPWRERRRRSWRWWLDLAWKSLSPYPIAVLNDTSRGLSRVLTRELARGAYDLFVCDFLQSTLNVPVSLPCPALLFTHNVESRILRRQLEGARGPARLFWARQHRLMERYERTAAARFDGVVAVSESDRREFESRFGLPNVRAVPTGVDADFFAPSGREVEPGSMVFSGSMDWLPNQEGIRWFVLSVLPRIRREVPGARLTVVGRSPPAAIVKELTRSEPVVFTGWVEDVRPWIDRAACYVVPLRIGGGTRIKIYQALAMEKALVSTTVGAEGLPLEPGVHFHRADGAGEFARTVIRCLEAREEARRMGRRARELVRRSFSWDRAAELFASFGEELIAAGTTSRPRACLESGPRP